MAPVSDLYLNNKGHSFDALLQDILEMTMNVLGVDAGVIRLYEEETRELVIRAHKGISPEALRRFKRRKYSVGLAWKSVLSRAPVVCQPNDLEMYLYEPSGCGLIVPLTCNKKIIGAIVTSYRDPPGELGERDASLFSLIGNQIGIALEHARLADELRKRNVALEALEKLSKAVNKLDFDQIFKNAADSIMRLFGCRFVFIRTLDRKTGELVYTRHKGLTSAELALLPKRHLMDVGLVMSAVKSKKVCIVRDLLTKPSPDKGRQKFLRSIGCRGLVIVPLVSREKVLGAVYIGYSEPHAAAEDEINLYTAIGELVGTAMDNAVMYEEKLEEIAERKRAEKELNDYREHLEKLVAERTAELERKNAHLAELNTALRVLLQMREEDRKEMEERFVFNIRNLVSPYLEEMKRGKLNAKQRYFIHVMGNRLNEIISPMVANVRQFNLTPKEIQVAAMVRDGKTTKEIAEILGVEPCSIDAHRNSIRKKLSLNRKSNLQSKLQSMQRLD